jgi:hypothetical protein
MGQVLERSLVPFQFERDTFTFANELIWRYQFDPVTGAMTVCRSDPPPTYSHRCFVVVRSARQFRYHARFDPAAPALTPDRYTGLIRQVVARDPRRRSRPENLIVFPGFAGLREFSEAHSDLLKANCGGPVQSYFLRSHWRMVFPVPPWHQEHMARQLVERVHEGALPLIHIFRFPRVTINHGILIYGVKEKKNGLEFTAYDPNITSEPVRLFYDASSRAFDFPPAIYWSGGTVKVIEIFRGGLY